MGEQWSTTGKRLTEKQAWVHVARMAKIREWALAHYEQGGHWIVEATSDEELATFESIAAAKAFVRLLQSREADTRW